MAACSYGAGVKILVMGGTRFVGKPLVAQLQACLLYTSDAADE